MTYDENSNFGELLDNPKTKELLLKYIPKIGDPSVKLMMGMARPMDLKTVVAFPQANLPANKFEELLIELKAL